MDITGTTALVTGANRGLGRHLAAELRDRGARVYAAARDPHAVDLAGVTPIALDITDPASVAAAAQAASGVAILVNNAGSSTGSSLLTGDPAAIRPRARRANSPCPGAPPGEDPRPWCTPGEVAPQGTPGERPRRLHGHQ